MRLERLIYQAKRDKKRAHPMTAKQLWNAEYYQRNQERLKAKALARWRKLHGK